jgi:uncharacterized membrane protein
MSLLESFLHLFDIICMVGGLFYTLSLKWSRLFINAKKIKVECTLIQSQSTVFSSSQAMAQRKETPKMIYPKSALFWECKCRLCDGIIDKTYCNNLFLELAK